MIRLEQARSTSLQISRKDKPFGQIFGSGFIWSEAFDAAADIYSGVSKIDPICRFLEANVRSSMSFGPNLPHSGSPYGVSTFLVCQDTCLLTY